MNDNVWSWNIERFLAEAASSAPTPGGGSVSAYVGALAASMVSMVANLTIGKEKYQNVENEAKEILKKSQQCMTDLQLGLTRDIEIFNQFMDVFKMPKETEEQKARREEQRQAVLQEATESPMEIARRSLIVLHLTLRIAPIGNKGAISDAGVAAYLAESALRSALMSVDINLPQITDVNYIRKIQKETGEMKTVAKALLEETIKAVQRRI